MAMLAEQRRKVKYSVNPRGSSWSKDENKFGQKLMEKMGWSKGKGLGAKLDGNVDHVSVQLKTDSRGVGCSKSHADNWIAHQDDFNSLLANLNKDHSEEGGDNPANSKVLDLSEKSKTSKGRLHYQKFAKGKDLSLKTENDLDCVFGKRKITSHQNTPEVSSSESEAEETEKNKLDCGLKTVTSTDSIQDYFAKKMAERKNRLKGIPQGDQQGMTEDDSRLGASLEDDLVKEEEEVAKSNECKEKKKKSKKKKKMKENEEIIDTPSDSDKQDTVEEKLKLEENEEVSGHFKSLEKGCESEVTESKKSKKKKSRKRKLSDEENLANMDEANKNISSEKSKKVKKSERVENEISSNEKDVIVAKPNKSKDGKKKKNKKSKNKKENKPYKITSKQETQSEITVTEHLSEADRQVLEVGINNVETITAKGMKKKGKGKQSKAKGLNLQGFKGSNIHEMSGYTGLKN